MTTNTCLFCGKGVQLEDSFMCDSCAQGDKNKTVTPEERVALINQIVEKKSWRFIDGVMVDLFTASAIKTIYDNLSHHNQEVYRGFHVTKMADYAWKLLDKQGV